MLYDIGFILFSIFYLPALICKGKLHKDFGERFGNFAKEKRARLAAAKDVIWIQAVSVGEVALCRTLLPLIRKRFPGSAIVFSTITRTGNELARKLFSGDAIIIYFPLDFSFVVRRVIRLIRPKAYVMIETEIWPNVLKELARRSVPAILMNGRISDRSYGKYREVRTFLRPTLRRIAAYCMQSKADADRIIAIGAPPERVQVTGNMKFDAGATAGARPAAGILASLGLPADAMLIVAGSTHPGEEEVILAAYRRLCEFIGGLHLLIAPRHIERTGDVEDAVRGAGLSPARVSQLGPRPAPGQPSRVLILDMIGRLGEIYSVATVVFIGGSLIKHGGQNPIEPALFEKPVIFGPHMFNFRAVAAALLERGGAVQVDDKAHLLERMTYLLRNPRKRSELGNNAKMAIMENRGASERNSGALARVMATTGAA